MRPFSLLLALAVAVTLSGCGTTTNGNIPMSGTFCVGPVCVTAPQVALAAPEVPTRETYNRAMAGMGPVASRPVAVMATAPAPAPVMAVAPMSAPTVACQAY